MARPVGSTLPASDVAGALGTAGGRSGGRSPDVTGNAELDGTLFGSELGAEGGTGGFSRSLAASGVLVGSTGSGRSGVRVVHQIAAATAPTNANETSGR